MMLIFALIVEKILIIIYKNQQSRIASFVALLLADYDVNLNIGSRRENTKMEKDWW